MWHPQHSPAAYTSLSRGRWLTVNQTEQCLLFRYGKLDRVLTPGRYRFWDKGYAIQLIDLRPWVLLVPTQELLTSDGAAVKLTVAGQIQVSDPVVFATAMRNTEQALYLAIQISLRQLIAGMSIDDLLASRGSLGASLIAGLGDVQTLGLAVQRLEIKDIILAGELKKAQSEVVVARAQAQAALERARGETAALRSLANAARIAADNPALLQLRLLQQLDTSRGNTIVVNSSSISPVG
jgi:regulator of protease activity HflC (stomatin/prohibitin superfamily)